MPQAGHAPDEIAAWLRLLQTPGCGRQRARQLLAAFGSPQGVFEASPVAQRQIVGDALVQALRTPPADLDPLVEDTLAWLEHPAHHLLFLGDASYPAGWLHMADPPLMLHLHGEPACLTGPDMIAIVGSRHPTASGTALAREFAADLGRAGLAIVSGLAAGIDAAAHLGALDVAAPTLALVGTGLDRCYPRQHEALAARIVAAGGLLVSEHALGTPPLAPHFPQRNRLIAGLALGTLVVEAALQSGSLITARLALESNREVFAIPGSIRSPQSRGCHRLIRDGARLVESVDDILEDLQPLRRSAPAAPCGPHDDGDRHPSSPAPDPDDTPADPILAALGWSPATLDALQARTGWATPLLQARLLELELSEDIVRLPGQIFQRQNRA
ncbi:MAG: DNA-protecting protein DprA [Pseudomonadota bacterium]|jgi:DNA processing protein|nr:processing protein [Pseudomonadota bacterium]